MKVQENNLKCLTSKNAIINFFEKLGYTENDIIGICFGIGDKKDIGEMQPIVFTSIEDLPKQKYYKDLVDLDKTKVFKKGIFYASATFVSDTITSRRKENIKAAKEFVIDIDYGSDGHKKQSLLKNKEEALKFVKDNLPLPTIIVCTGGGLHIHYRLKEALSLKDYEDLSQAFVHHFEEIDDVCDCGHLFRIPNTYNTKNEKLKKVKIIETNDVDYSPADFFELIPNLTQVKDKDKNNVKKKRLQSKQQSNEKKEYFIDRSEKIYDIVEESLYANMHIKISALVKLIKSSPALYSHYNSDNALRADLIRICSKIHAAQAIYTTIEEREVVPEQCYIDMPQSAREIFDKVHFNTRQKTFDLTLGLICKHHQERQNAILNLPCSSGKSFMSIIYAAYLAQQGKRVWLVSEKIANCKTNAQYLRAMNVSVVAYHGRDVSVCAFDNNLFYRKNTPCSQCSEKCGAELKYLNKGTNKFDYPDASVVCCTHANYINAMSANQLPENLDLIIVDESPDTLNTITISEENISTLNYLVNSHSDYEERDKFRNFLASITSYNDFGTHKISPLDDTIATHILKYVFTQYHSEVLTEDEMSFAYNFFSFFRNKKIYGMLDETEEKKRVFHYIAGNINVKSDIPTIILDGSARNQITKWEDFIIVSCSQLVKNYPNTTLHLIKANPTKKKLSQSHIAKKIEHLAKNILNSKDNVIVFQNKKPVASVKRLKDIINENGASYVIMQRGEHIGSNKGKSCNKAIIDMSIFTTIADYALKASIVNDREIVENEIFNLRRGVRYPAQSRDGFCCKDINEQFILSLERNLYQAIMRGCIREDNTNTYDVIALIESYSIISHLLNDLPDMKIIVDEDSILNLYLQGYTISEIQKITKKSQSTISSAVQNIRERLGLKQKYANKDSQDAA